ncbi:MAG: hypothetical protein HEP71_25735 [Roseivirga sp.]|nr:hypothetical protein [Roseivirga sp.]
MPEPKKPFNPLKAVWNVISTVSGAVGLVSFSDDWHAWNGVFDQMISVYRSYIHWPIWLEELNIPQWGLDYLVIGGLYASAYLKGSFRIGIMSDVKLQKSLEDKFAYTMYMLTFLTIVWPLWTLMQVAFVIFGYPINNDPDKTLESSKGTIYWFSIVLLLFLTFLLVNALISR